MVVFVCPRESVHLKRVTGTSLVPTAFGDDQAGPSHDGLEMKPMGSRRSVKCKRPSPEPRLRPDLSFTETVSVSVLDLRP